MSADHERFARAISLFDAANSETRASTRTGERPCPGSCSMRAA